jgi:hypothetical protein
MALTMALDTTRRKRTEFGIFGASKGPIGAGGQARLSWAAASDGARFRRERADHLVDPLGGNAEEAIIGLGVNRCTSSLHSPPRTRSLAGRLIA